MAHPAEITKDLVNTYRYRSVLGERIRIQRKPIEFAQFVIGDISFCSILPVSSATRKPSTSGLRREGTWNLANASTARRNSG